MEDVRALRNRYLVARWFTNHREDLHPQPFESESTRWLELVVALLMKAGRVPEVQARSAANTLAALDLLAVPACAALAADAPHGALMEEVLRGVGIAAEDATRARLALTEAAQALHKLWGGKVQRYLRTWGERMLAELPADFGITALPADEVRYAFTWWLQAALGMPVAMAHPALLALAQREDTSLEALVTAADALDLNVALLDEAALLELAGPLEEEA